MGGKPTQADTCMSWECSGLPIMSVISSLERLLAEVVACHETLLQIKASGENEQAVDSEIGVFLEGFQRQQFLAGMIRITIKCSCLNRKPAWVSSWLQQGFTGEWLDDYSPQRQNSNHRQSTVHVNLMNNVGSIHGFGDEAQDPQIKNIIGADSHLAISVPSLSRNTQVPNSRERGCWLSKPSLCLSCCFKTEGHRCL